MNTLNPVGHIATESISDLEKLKQPCNSKHPFLQKFGLGGNHHSQLSLCIADVHCLNGYVRALRSPDGEVRNLLLHIEASSGTFEQLYWRDQFEPGAFASYGKLTDGVTLHVTIDVPSAAHLYEATGECAVAALHLHNLEAVCQAIQANYPNCSPVLALDWKDDGVGQDLRVLSLVQELSHKTGMPYVTSGNTASFTELAQTQGPVAVAARLEKSLMPSAETAMACLVDQAHVSPQIAIPASTPQNGSGLLRDLVAAVRRAVVTSEEAALAVALWIVFSHIYMRFPIAPLLVISSPEPRCGKTNLLTLLIRLCANAWAASNMTEAVLYRVIKKRAPTLVIDEADTFMVGNKAMTGIINSGYNAATARVMRVGKEGIESLNTYGPKAVALIGELAETLMDRAIHIRLKRKLRSDLITPVPQAGIDELTFLHTRVARWAADHHADLERLDVPRIAEINDRANDNAAPLLAIAAACGEHWLERAISAFKVLAEPGDSTRSISTQLLADIKAIFEATRKNELRTADLLEHLNAQDEAPWPTYSRGRNMTARDLAGLLTRYGIKSYQRRDAAGAVVRGYGLHQFNDAFQRYVL